MDRPQIGKYRIVGKIGQGAMGEVFKAEDPVLHRFVAVKTISGGGLAPESDLRKRFLREAQSAARLSHPNIITVFDFGEDQDRVFMAMELLEGIDLKEAIRARKLPSVEDQLEVMEQICDGLAFAHAKGVVHRDIKPANIHLQPDGKIKIMDFGLARLGESEMTATGMILGTPHYMSPEQVRGEKADARSDVFSLGAVFYELLAHHKAFDADSMHSILFQVLEHQPAPLRNWAPDLPPRLVQVVEKALEKDAARRFQHGGELRDAVRSIRRALRTGEDSAALAGLSGVEPRAAGTPAGAAGEAPTYAPTSRSAAASRSALARQLDASGSGAAPAEACAETVLTPGQGRASASRSLGPAVAPAPSRVPLIGGIAVGAVIVAGAAGFLLMRGPGTAPPSAVPAGNDKLGVLTEALVTSQLELARRNLDDKQYGSAAKQAEQVLKLDAANTGAQQVLAEAQARLAEVDGAATEARRAMDAGQVAQAATALTRVLALDPRHPVAGELSERLNRHFQGQSTEARRLMAAARAAAAAARAETVRPHPEAVALATEADVLHRRGEYAVAAQKFLESRDRFEQARRAAVAQAQASRAVAAAAPAPPVTRPAAIVAPPMAIEPIPLPVVTVPPAPATLPPAAVVLFASEEPAIRRVIADYERAIETRDLGLFRAVKPNLSGQEERTLRATFAQVKSHQIEMTLGPIEVDGAQARVSLSRHDVIDGKPFAFQQNVVLVKQGGAWTIREIGR